MTIEEFKHLLAEYENCLPQSESQSGEAQNIQVSWGGTGSGRSFKHAQLEKAIQAFQAATDAAVALNEQLKLIPKPLKTARIFKAHGKRISFWRAKIGIITLMAARQIGMIVAQLIPKYPKGGFENGGIARVGSMGEEIITEGLFDKVAIVQWPMTDQPACSLNFGQIKRIWKTDEDFF